MDGTNGSTTGRGRTRSKKAHIAPPPRQIMAKVKPGADEKEVGQFTGRGNPPLEKK